VYIVIKFLLSNILITLPEWL